MPIEATRIGINSHFVTAPDSEGRRYLAPFSTYVAADGAFTWASDHIPGGWGFHSLSDVRVEDVVRTREEEFFDGDPFALLIEERTGAGGPVSSWTDLGAFLLMADGVFNTSKDAVKVLRFVVETYQKQWEFRHATPLRLLFTILERDSWRYPELVPRLNISLSNAVDLLAALGYQQDTAEPLIYRLSESVPQAELRSRTSCSAATHVRLCESSGRAKELGRQVRGRVSVSWSQLLALGESRGPTRAFRKQIVEGDRDLRDLSDRERRTAERERRDDRVDTAAFWKSRIRPRR